MNRCTYRIWQWLTRNGQPDDARRHIDDAIDKNRKSGARGGASHCRGSRTEAPEPDAAKAEGMLVAHWRARGQQANPNCAPR
jgi:hypothetical protein